MPSPRRRVALWARMIQPGGARQPPVAQDSRLLWCPSPPLLSPAHHPEPVRAAFLTRTAGRVPQGASPCRFYWLAQASVPDHHRNRQCLRGTFLARPLALAALARAREPGRAARGAPFCPRPEAQHVAARPLATQRIQRVRHPLLIPRRHQGTASAAGQQRATRAGPGAFQDRRGAKPGKRRAMAYAQGHHPLPQAREVRPPVSRLVAAPGGVAAPVISTLARSPRRASSGVHLPAPPHRSPRQPRRRVAYCPCDPAAAHPGATTANAPGANQPVCGLASDSSHRRAQGADAAQPHPPARDHDPALFRRTAPAWSRPPHVRRILDRVRHAQRARHPAARRTRYRLHAAPEGPMRAARTFPPVLQRRRRLRLWFGSHRLRQPVTRLVRRQMRYQPAPHA